MREIDDHMCLGKKHVSNGFHMSIMRMLAEGMGERGRTRKVSKRYHVTEFELDFGHERKHFVVGNY